MANATNSIPYISMYMYICAFCALHFVYHTCHPGQSLNNHCDLVGITTTVTTTCTHMRLCVSPWFPKQTHKRRIN